MNVTYDKLNDVEGKIVVTLEEKDYADKVKKELKNVAKNRPEPGFRAGKTPMGIIQKKYGDAVKYDVVNKEVSDALFKYIEDNKIKVLGNPVPVKNDNFDIKNTDFTFEFEVGIAPEVKVEVNKDIHVPYYTIKVSDKMMEDQDKALRRRFGRQEPGDTVNEDAVIKGVITELNEDGTVKEGCLVQESGIVAPKYFKSEEQRDLFMGKHVGDKVIFNPAATCESNPTEMSSMLGIGKEDVDKYPGNFSFDITEIIVLNPAEDGKEYFDALFGEDKVHNEEEYRAALKDMIAAQLQSDSNYRFTIDAKEVIEKANGKMEFPERILKEYLKMQNDEVTDENVDKVYEEAIGGLEWQLIADKIAETKGIKLEESDLMEVARLMARNEFAKYGMTQVPEESLNKYAMEILKDERTRRRVANDAFEMQVFKAIHDDVTLDNKEVDVEEFNALFAPAQEA